MNESHRSRFGQVRLGAKLNLSFAMVLLLLLLLGGLAAQELRASIRITDDINARWLPTVRWTLDLRSLMAGFRNQEFELILAADAEERKPHLAGLNAMGKEIDRVQAVYAELSTQNGEREAWDRLVANWRLYLVEDVKIRGLAEADQADTARSVIRDKSEAIFIKVLADLDHFVDEGVHRSDEAALQSRKGYTGALAVMGTAIVFALALGFGLAWWLRRIIARPLEEAIGAASLVARGDLRVDLQTTRRDEIGDLFGALRTMVSGLASVVSEVRSGVNTIAGASKEIADGTMDLSNRTERQAGELQQTAATLHRLTDSASSNAEVAEQATKLASTAHSAASSGGQIVDTVVGRMGDISQASKRIAEITGTIDSISFQTNILALNAAVEAARAGEQGRGFAVVASEVRTLAQRSSQAAKEIRTLIGDSVEKVDAGVVLANDAGRTMHEVVNHIARLSQLVVDMSAASKTQHHDVADINRMLTQLDESTQQNASMVEQSAAASASLQEQAGRLTQAVAVFQV